MADTDIAGLAAASAAADTDIILINEAGTTKTITMKQLRDLIGFYKAALGSDHAVNASTTCTSTITLSLPEAGTYWYEICIVAQSNTAASGLRFGVNFTGTVTAGSCRHCLYLPTTGVGTSTGVADEVGAGTGQLLESTAQTAFSTSAGNMGTVGVITTSTPALYFIRGIIVATSSGDLVLYHGGEVASGITTVLAGSAIIAWRSP